MKEQERIAGEKQARAPSGRAATYHDISEPSGRCRLRIDNVPMFGRGQIFVIGVSGNWEPLPGTGGLVFDSSDGSTIPMEMLDCLHHESGQPMRFVGYLEANHTPGVRHGESSSIPPIDSPMFVGCTPPTAQTRRLARDEAFEAELARYTQLRNQGVDPSLKLPFIKAYTGKSHSTIYREIARGKFPPPIRHGKSVSWLFSHVDAYRLGNWIGATDMTAAGHGPVKPEYASPKPHAAGKRVNVGSHLQLASPR